MGKLLIQTTCVLALLFATTPSRAEDRQEICARYMTESGWSKPYDVRATVLDGYELNQKIQSMSYNNISKYVVIFWQQHDASVIELSMPFIGVAEQDGRDQEGRAWEVSSSAGWCP